ncbi:response regulator [Pseudoxanthomonas winnipegensis]|uniref:Response regulator transcription factor n=1 Tax=Pseudoxanthomonas winnipegensis TaxID=2480810 RepID=A0A4Q8LR17_9GAMM|nr:response regulator transcription factor [Pseudoxanthomonas winnipegensis]RZZ84818.1 response regulator transcription factor [Pseudoxanthomonas winnipegensis]TAA33759.1 response regulator transcription factor [Pseudoxanthomonas winnipegensis]
MQSQIGVLVVDDHPLLRDGLRAMLEAQPDMRLLGEAGDGHQALERYAQLAPDVVLMDLQMPGMDGVEAIERLRQHDPRARILVLTTYSGDARAVRALQAGAAGYLLKDMLRHDLLDTIRTVFAGQRPRMPMHIAEGIACHVADDGLSQRETVVLSAAASGLTNKAIGQRLSISEQTVKAHMKSLMAKLGARDRTHAVTIALQRGIISLERIAL